MPSQFVVVLLQRKDSLKCLHRQTELPVFSNALVSQAFGRLLLVLTVLGEWREQRKSKGRAREYRWKVEAESRTVVTASTA